MSECAAALISVTLALTNLSAKKDTVISRKFADKGELIHSEKHSAHPHAHTECCWISSEYSLISWLPTLRREILIFLSFICTYKARTMTTKSMLNNFKQRPFFFFFTWKLLCTPLTECHFPCDAGCLWYRKRIAKSHFIIQINQLRFAQ